MPTRSCRWPCNSHSRPSTASCARRESFELHRHLSFAPAITASISARSRRRQRPVRRRPRSPTTCSGFVAPAITLATTGRASSHANASSSKRVALRRRPGVERLDPVHDRVGERLLLTIRGHPREPRARGRRGAALVLARQHAAREREVRNERDVVLRARVEHALLLRDRGAGGCTRSARSRTAPSRCRRRSAPTPRSSPRRSCCTRSRAPCPRARVRPARRASPRAASPDRGSGAGRGRCGRCRAGAASRHTRGRCTPRSRRPCARRRSGRRTSSRSAPRRAARRAPDRGTPRSACRRRCRRCRTA